VSAASFDLPDRWLPDSPIFGRVFAAGLIVCSIFLGAVSYRRKGWWWLLKIPTKGRWSLVMIPVLIFMALVVFIGIASLTKAQLLQLAVVSAFPFMITVGIAARMPGAVVLAFALALAFCFKVAATAAFVAILPLAVFGGTSIVAILTTFPIFAVAIAGGVGAVVSGASAFAAVILVVSNISRNTRWRGIFLSFFVVSMFLCCLWAARFFSTGNYWDEVGPLIVFMGFLTVINAPLDWVSLGLTRALLRWGLALGGWWPFVLGCVDAFIATQIVVLLVLAVITGVQTFTVLGKLSGALPILNLDLIVGSIQSDPMAAQNWWIYLMVLSTMIPSLTNLMVGGASLMRGLPGVPCLLLRHMPANKPVPTLDRNWIATVLTLQIVGGGILGIVVQAAIAVTMYFYVMPWFRVEILQITLKAVDFDLPRKLLTGLW
jgi:hypothetical protein